MAFWMFMTACLMLIPGVMIAFGRYSLKGGPKEINSVYGYRTGMSMKNMDTWTFAHREIGRLWSKWGLILLAASLTIMLLVWGKGEKIVGTAGTVLLFAQPIPLLCTIVPVEKKLRRTFYPDGTRREGV